MPAAPTTSAHPTTNTQTAPAESLPVTPPAVAPDPVRLPNAEGGRAKVIVLGAGFGGLTFCHTLKHPDASVTLIDRQNHHLFQPMLYQVATAGLSAPDIAQPARSILKHRMNVTVLLEEVQDFDLDHQRIVCSGEICEYDYLIIALGGVTSYFGHPEWEQFAPGLKSLDDALEIRRRLLVSFEKAETMLHPEEQQRLMTMVIVGGGATGVEMAGAFSEVSQHVLAADFRRIDPKSARIVLLEGGPRLLPGYTPDLCENAKQKLEGFGVEVRLDTRVKEVREGEVVLEGGEVIQAATIVWAAGIAANPLTKKLGVELDRAGRIKVLPDLSLPGHPEVFAVGDIVTITDPHNHQPVPGVSPAAMQMGEHVARVITDELDAREINPATRKPFSYWNKGIMATIGRKAAVAMIGKVKLTGFIAWLAWLCIHLFFLIGFRNKLMVMFQWVYQYFTFGRSARVITGIKPHLYTDAKRHEV